MNRATLKSVLGFFGTLIEKYTPFKFRGDSYDAVYNYLEINPQITCSGQPTAAQFESIKAAGYETVINLLPSGHENGLKNQRAVLEGLGIAHVEIPVDWKNPTLSDFEQFTAAIQDAGDQKIWIHCAANMRVTAFLYRYRRDVLKEDEAEARADMNKIWDPNSFKVWKAFVSSSPLK